MTKPVVLSSGLVLDDSTAKNKNGAVQYRYCPKTKQKLSTFQLPVNSLQDLIHERNTERLQTALNLAKQMQAAGEEDKLREVCDFANALLEEVGD